MCLYCRILVDDGLHEFRAGVRVFLVFDSCHSATAAQCTQLVEVGRKAVRELTGDASWCCGRQIARAP